MEPIEAPPPPPPPPSPARGEGVDRVLGEANSLHLLAIAFASLARRDRSRRKLSTRCVRSTSSPPNPRSVSTAAISAARSPAPLAAASTTMRARRGGNGRGGRRGGLA